VESSTELLAARGDDYPALLQEQRQRIRSAVDGAGGALVQTVGEECVAVFDDASAALLAAANAQRALAQLIVRVRIGVHTGSAALVGSDYVGLDVHRAARICSAGHGGQILVSSAAADGRIPEGCSLHALGEHVLKGIERPEQVFQLDVAGLRTEFPRLRADQAPDPLATTDRRLAASLRAALRIVGRRNAIERLDLAVGARGEAAKPEEREPWIELKVAVIQTRRRVGPIDDFLAVVDTDALSERAGAEGEPARSTLTRVQELRRLRDEAEHRFASATRELDRQVPHDLQDELTRLGQALDTAYEAVPKDGVAFKLRRTRRRGVFRQGSMWVVPYVDELGVERRRPFDNAREARDFARAVRIDSARLELARYAGAPHDKSGLAGAGAGGPAA
jgi:hypothetical protein